MIYIWMMIAVILMMAEVVLPRYNYICFSLGAILATVVEYYLGNFLIEFLVFMFSSTGFMLWLKPRFHFHKKR